MIRVNISIEGLGVVCFNEDAKQKRGEIALLHHEHHALTLRVETRDGALVRKEAILPNTRINFVNKEPATVYKLNDDGRFVRKNGFGNDLHDLRWILDLEGNELHNEELQPLGGRPQLTRIYIPDAFFYTEKLSREECNKVLPNTKKEHLGWVGETLGAAIVAEEVMINISGTSPIELKEQSPDKLEYRVIIKNVREHFTHAPRSDFGMYYHLLKDDDGEQFDLELISVQHVPELICALARWGETGTIDEL
jgi:hypothetical protein